MKYKNFKYMLGPELKTHDPYDLWKTIPGLLLKKMYYKYGKVTIPLVVPFFLADIYAPRVIRAFIKPQEYPTVRAFAVLISLKLFELTEDKKYIDLASDSVKWLMDNTSQGYHGACWGLNMPWMTKGGYYPPSTPFITHTPYCVEALLKYHDITNDKQSLDVALSSLDFLENDIKVLFKDPGMQAVSYGPFNEKGIVINANSYAMMLYGAFAGRLPEKKDILIEKSHQIYNFIRANQNTDGSWFYYADQKRGNFIDCFHSCFVIKNLIKYGHFADIDVSTVTSKALNYILNNFIDSKYFLARRFTHSANPSMVKFDLYDQAELLNVFCLTGDEKNAKKLHNSIMKYFYIPSKNNFGYQIDCLGILNRMSYLRWAVMPAIYALVEYYSLTQKPGEV